jgi:BirA family biotin operon repressor/biotin-[acetyl-CoA-carboxylase] ligase
MTAAPFDSGRAARLIEERGLGLPLTSVLVTTSTNDLALEAARSGAAHGAVFVAEKQTRGRGRQGRRWESPPGEHLTFSVLLHTLLSPDRARGIPLVVGLAVREAVAARLDRPVSVKWPNDVWCGSKKLAGILVESVARGPELRALVVGIGINVRCELHPEIRDSATSLELSGARDLDREPLLVDVLAGLAMRLERFDESGLESLLGELAMYDALRGVRVRAGEIVGTARGVDPGGALRIVSDDGREHLVFSGTVERVEAARG